MALAAEIPPESPPWALGPQGWRPDAWEHSPRALSREGPTASPSPPTPRPCTAPGRTQAVPRQPHSVPVALPSPSCAGHVQHGGARCGQPPPHTPPAATTRTSCPGSLAPGPPHPAPSSPLPSQPGARLPGLRMGPHPLPVLKCPPASLQTRSCLREARTPWVGPLQTWRPVTHGPRGLSAPHPVLLRQRPSGGGCSWREGHEENKKHHLTTPLSFKEKEKVPITTSKTTRDPALRRPRKYRPRRREMRWHGALSGPRADRDVRSAVAWEALARRSQPLSPASHPDARNCGQHTRCYSATGQMDSNIHLSE